MRVSLLGYPYDDRRTRLTVPALLALLALGLPLTTPAQVHHDLRVTLDPERGTLAAEDTLTLPPGTSAVDLTLHAGLEPTTDTPGASLERTGTVRGAVPLERFRARLPAGQSRITLRYGGAIRHPVTDAATDGGRPMPTTPGLIGGDAVYLDGASGWYPDTAGPLTFSLAVTLPEGWEAVSQGTAAPGVTAGPGRSVRWSEDQPQDELFLIAAPFTVYRQATPHGEAQVYLRTPDPELAGRYLEATGRYLDLYSRLIGPYPYGKFALVENAWDTGYGMPSFTLIGGRVLRLPFLIDSSYPHEVLHNWWGNSVWIDYASGNWAEGLTSYLADHLVQEQRGAGAAYRRAALQKYADYVDEAEDFPLTAFRGRHGEVTQAVGYNKTLMVFHTLRRELGDAVFVDGLRRLYRDHRFRTAGWTDLRRAFEAAAGRDLEWFFGQWVERTGAPSLRLSEVAVEPVGDRFRVTGLLEQAGAGPTYRLRVPVAVQAAGEPEAVVRVIALDGPSVRFELETAGRPLRLLVDPDFDLFRRLDPAELPASFGRLFGARSPLVVLPSRAPAELLEAYRALARDWGRGGEVVMDRDLSALPADRPVWVLGWENRFRSEVADALARQGGALTDAGVTLTDAPAPGRTLARADHGVALALPRPGTPALTLGWLGADEASAVAGIGRKLRHYGRKGYVVFASPALNAAAQGEWQVLESPLAALLDPAGGGSPLRLPARPTLVDRLGPEAAPGRTDLGVDAGVDHPEQPRRPADLRHRGDPLDVPQRDQALDHGLELGGLAEAPPQPLLALAEGKGLQGVRPDPAQHQRRVADTTGTFFRRVHGPLPRSIGTHNSGDGLTYA